MWVNGWNVSGVDKKIDQCPHCGSKVGFMVIIRLGGYQYDTYNYSGKQINCDRQGTDDIEKRVECVECKKSFDINLVNYNI